MNIKKGLGEKIQFFRKQAGLTQEAMAERLGVDTVSLSKIETGKNYPTAENLEKICTILNVHPSQLFLFDKNKSSAEHLAEIQASLKILLKNKKILPVLNEILRNLL